MLEKNGQDFFCGINRLPDIDHLKKLIFHHPLIFQGRDPVLVGDRDMGKALDYTLWDVLFEYWIKPREENITKRAGGKNQF